MKTGFIRIVFAALFALLLLNAVKKETAFSKVYTALKRNRKRLTNEVVKHGVNTADNDMEIIDKAALLFANIPFAFYN